ncbi:MAG: DUF4401 domain-containing protein [Burkholderiales bacterium]|nr:MAG: DUF4401 domain-containing protein [Betaproteobacteria bacterium]TAG83169.1 MAG: DUF4401 domain-containing protein [Burkholderiales bacterium]
MNASSTSHRLTLGALWSKLSSENLVRGDLPEIALPPEHAPVVGRVLMGFLGWLSGVFLLISMAAPFYAIFDSVGAFWVIGSILLYVAWKLFTVSKHTEFLEHFAQSLSVAGQLSILVAFFSLMDKWSGRGALVIVALFCLALQTGLLLLIPHRMHRFMSSLFALCAIAVLFYEAKVEYLFPAFVAAAATVIWLSETQNLATQRDSLLRPVGYAAWAILIFVCAVGFADFIRERGTTPGYRSAALAVVLLAVVFYLTKRAKASSRGASLLGALSFSAAAFAAPGLIACAIAFVLAYARGHIRASALALVAAACYLVGYYYQINTTLMQKAVSLAFVAAILAISAFVVSRLNFASENAQ